MARLNTRWLFVKRHSVANPVACKPAITVRAPGVGMAPLSNGVAARRRQRRRGEQGTTYT